jgi:MEMO1 family protein
VYSELKAEVKEGCMQNKSGSVSEKVRSSAVAGAFYPGNVGELRQAIEKYMEEATPPALEKVCAVIVPHAGYVYSGPTAGFAYKLLTRQAFSPTRVILMGPAHRFPFSGVALGDYTAFRTPLGEVPVDLDFVRTLTQSASVFSSTPQAHAGEHCIEVQLPFLQMIYDDFSMVPMLFGAVDPLRVADLLSPHLTSDDLIVVSSDLSHFHDYETASHLDRAFVDAVLHENKSKAAQGEACGRAPALSLMQIADEKGWEPHLLDYRNSGDTAGNKREVVGYAALAYTGG